MTENYVIHIKIDGGSKRMAKAIQRISDESWKEICQKVKSQFDFVDEEENSPTPKGEYLTIRELCNLLKIGRQTIWRNSKKGILHPRKIGNRVLFARADIDEYLRKGGNHAEQ